MCASLKIPQVLIFASESGCRLVGPASPDNLINISENDELYIRLATAVVLL